jgi:hypothetical protein
MPGNRHRIHFLSRVPGHIRTGTWDNRKTAIPRRRLDILRREVNRFDATSIIMSQIAARAADATSRIEDPHKQLALIACQGSGSQLQN